MSAQLAPKWSPVLWRDINERHRVAVAQHGMDDATETLKSHHWQHFLKPMFHNPNEGVTKDERRACQMLVHAYFHTMTNFIKEYEK